ncbi:uncharacterized protein LOC134220421 [Armigeres subalbatus]|uniref:uncharacterized protein LOC134220421 n=1 Tax=Armigeres subalbatus TaxID=124917 RepID=UPI002ED67E50
MISPEGQPLPFLSGELDQSYFKRLQKERPGVQFLASFGGTSVPAELFSHLSEDESRLLKFVQQLVRFTKQTGFNGLDIAWMYPIQADNGSYSLLLRQLRAACDRENLILTVTVPSNPAAIGKSYPVKEIENSAHYVILSTNEFRKLKKTSLIAPLYSINAGSSNSVDFHVNAWKLAGITREKIVIIIQPTSLTYKLFQPKEYQLGTPVVRLKVRPFFKICHKLYSGSLEIYEERARCPYAFRELSWYSYENRQSIKEKVEYVVNHQLGGISVAFYDDDDPTNLCGDGRHPLTGIVLSSLNGTEAKEYKSSGGARRSRDNGDEDSYEDFVNIHVVDPGDSYVREAAVPLQDKNQFSPVENEGDHSRKSAVVLRQIPSATDSLCSKCKPKFPNPTTTTAAPLCKTKKLRKDCDRSYDIPYQCPESGEDDDHWHHVASDGSCTKCVEKTTETSMVLVDSDKAFAELTKKSGQNKDSLLFSEQSVSCSGVGTNPLFTEPKTRYVVKPPPPAAQYDPAKSRLGIIATCKNGNPPPKSNCMRCNTNSEGLKCCPCAHPSQPPCWPNIMTTGAVQSTTPCPQAALMELLSKVQSLARVNRNVETKAVDSPVLFTTCPYDGIIADPRDPRQYYLCRQGLPLNDENRFSCADGYVYDSANQKCVPEQN